MALSPLQAATIALERRAEKSARPVKLRLWLRACLSSVVGWACAWVGCVASGAALLLTGAAGGGGARVCPSQMAWKAAAAAYDMAKNKHSVM